jgi:starch-binding outer membrane protein SusE/F
MKKILSLSIMACLIVVAIFSCKKQETRAILSADPGAPTLSATPSNVAVDSLNDEKTALTINWTKATYGFDAAANYSLQIAKNEASLGITQDSVGKVFAMGPLTSKSWSNINLNLLAESYGIKEFEEGFIYARVISTLANNTTVAPLKSAVLKVKIRTTSFVIPMDTIWCPGDYQGWSPADAGTLMAIKGSGNFSGILEKTKVDGTMSSGDFKFTAQPGWGPTNYGAGTGLGTLSTDGGAGNLNLVDGTYKITVNTNNLTWTSDPINWAVTGSATTLGWPAGPGGTPGQDINLRYNNATKMYENNSVDLTANEIKFRFNDDWGTNYGDDGNDGTLEPGAANIPVPVAGNYTIKLDVEHKTYSLIKN